MVGFARRHKWTAAAVALAGLAVLGAVAGLFEKTTSTQLSRFYAVDRREDRTGFFRQPRYEFFFTAPGAPSARAYLGTCFTPGFVTDHLHLTEDGSCFAVAEDGRSLVYMHLGFLAGAGQQARDKPTGVYLHAAGSGDRRLYGEAEINQIWGGAPVPGGAIRASWRGSSPSRAGAVCGQSLVIFADGAERVEGAPATPRGACR